MSSLVFLVGFGEELWKRYLPKYLEALGAGAGVVGLFGTTKDFFDAVYQYPGGWLADRVGRKPFVIATFVCFALFPVSVVPAWSFASLIAAFVVGGLLWKFGPQATFVAAGVVGVIGTIVFAATVEERYAG